MKLTLLTAFLFAYAIVFGQMAERSVIAASGNEFIADSKSINFLVGETIVETFSTSNLILTQGFIQPNSIVVGIKTTKQNDLNVNVYPNPVKSTFIVDFNELIQPSINYSFWLSIYDIYGRVIEKHKIDKGKTEIDITNLPEEVYVLKVTHENSGLNATFLLKKVN